MKRVAHLTKMLLSPAYRSRWRLQHTAPADLFQIYGDTAFDRYPDIFRFVQNQLQSCKNPRLLSFGCATGAEVFTLRHYFPQAEIIGIDINPHSIKQCKRQLRRHGDQRIQFYVAGSPHDLPAQWFDAIFCMAVLRHGDLTGTRPNDCRPLINFQAFEAMISEFDRCLKPDGYLCVTHSNFRFCDTECSATYEAVLTSNNGTPPLYGRNNRKLSDQTYTQTVFRKGAA